MSTYAIGDVQGCYSSLQKLLTEINFDAEKDTLWFCGDLINRGPDSLTTLRFIKSLGDSAVCVLGNHDLHFLAVAEGHAKYKPDDNIDKLLDSVDLEALVEWLRQQKLLHYDPHTGYTMIHAGLPPQWGHDKSLALASEVENTLQGDGYQGFLQNMYGNKPKKWKDELEGFDRLRCITNALTRLRFCKASGKMALKQKGPPGSQPDDLMPWFQVPDRASKDMKIVFGHWSTLGPYHEPGIYALDSGCLWGGRLTALRLEDEQWFHIKCKGYRIID